MLNLFEKVYSGIRWRVNKVFNGTDPKERTRQKEPVVFGNLRRLHPFSRHWGMDRGQAIDRHYIESFLAKHAADIKGTVLEIQKNTYTLRYGGKKVTCSETMDNNSENPTTWKADLRDTQALPERRYDCIIFTQTLQLIDDVDKVIGNLHRMLKEGGVVLCTAPTTSKMASEENGDYWRFTKAAINYLFSRHFSKENLMVEAYGNIFVNICFLEGISQEEVNQEELDYFDKEYPLMISVRAKK